MRAVLGFDRKLCADVVTAFISEVSRSLKLLAKHGLGPRPPPSDGRQPPTGQLAFGFVRGA